VERREQNRTEGKTEKRGERRGEERRGEEKRGVERREQNRTEGTAEKRREEKRRDDNERNYTWGRQNTISPGLKVPRQCPLILLVEVMHMIGINFYMALERLHVKQAVQRGIRMPVQQLL
jgi:hypothetical protein